MPQPPSLTPEQRQAALAKAAEARRARAEIKERLKMGSITLAELLTQADTDDMVAGIKVLAVLESLPGVGKVKAVAPWTRSASPTPGASGASATSSARRCWRPSAEPPPGRARVIIVVCGPGGVGKGTVVARLVAEDPGLWLSRSWTTRAQRPGERDDAYTYVDRATFEQRVAGDGFLEYAEFLGNLYGTPWPDAGDDHDVVLEIDVQGAAQVLERAPRDQVLFILLEPPSPEVQAERLRGRGDPPEQAERRIAVAQGELEAGRALGAVCIVNDDLDRTVAEVQRLIDDARAARA
jgi:guanylate kinase